MTGVCAAIASALVPTATTACAADAECVDAVGNAVTQVEQGITILGNSEDVDFYTGVNVNILHNVPNYTWEGTNIPFLDQAMARGDTIVYVSDFAQFPARTFAQEVQYIQESGYSNVIDMFRPWTGVFK
jgi:hypothetical protein